MDSPRQPFAIVLGVALLLESAAVSATFAQGLGAYKRGDYRAAAAEFTTLAEQGDARAQFALALLHDNGEGVPVDDAKALEWYRKSAAQGYAKAAYNLALMYERGEGVAGDAGVAKNWYLAAARGGNADALAWLEKLAAGKDIQAQIDLGVLYLTGTGVPKDYTKAQAWFRRAQTARHASAYYHLGLMLYHGWGLPADLGAAAEQFRLAADAGHAKAQFNLARMLRAGEGVAADPERARELFVRAATAGNASAQSALGHLSELAEAGTDPASAPHWYEQAALRGEPIALNNLGFLHAEGKLVAADDVRAFVYFRAAAARGETRAEANAELIATRLDESELKAAEIALAKLQARYDTLDQPPGSPPRP